METGPATRAYCSVCHILRPLNKNGRVRHHKHWFPISGTTLGLSVCPGSGEQPSKKKVA